MILTTAIILVFIVFVANIFRKLNVPLILIALAIGILFGSDVTGLIYFDDAVLARNLANVALLFILFAGGFGTRREDLRPVFRPVILLATVGVLLTASITAVLFCWLTGWPLLRSLLLSTIIASTDAAAVFSILRSRSVRSRVASITEIESAANDPMAIISTTFIIQLVIGAGVSAHVSALLFLWQLAAGVALGVLLGILGAFLFNQIRNIDVGYYYILLIGIILLSFSLAELCKASGMLAVFFSGFVLGNKKLPLKGGISSFTAALAFIANVGLFILLGLLVFPRQFSRICLPGILIFLIITFVARPLTVWLCLLFSKYGAREKTFLSWSGIRGAVPIVLATYPAAAGLDPQHQIFNIVFFAVVLSILIQGTTIGKLAQVLKITARSRKKPKQAMELVTVHETNYELVEIFIDEEIYRGECRIAGLTLPPGTTITMISRDNVVIAPSGSTIILPGDILYVLVAREQREETARQILRFFSEKSE